MSGGKFLKMWRNKVPLTGIGNYNMKSYLVALFVFYKSQILICYPLHWQIMSVL